MAEPARTGTTEEMFKCPKCGTMFPTEGEDEAECPNDGTRCTRDSCIFLNASTEDF